MHATPLPAMFGLKTNPQSHAFKSTKPFVGRRLKSSNQSTITTVVSPGRLMVWVYFPKKKERTSLNPIILTKTARWIDNVGKMLHCLSSSRKDTLTYCVNSVAQIVFPCGDARKEAKCHISMSLFSVIYRNMLSESRALAQTEWHNVTSYRCLQSETYYLEGLQ